MLVTSLPRILHIEKFMYTRRIEEGTEQTYPGPDTEIGLDTLSSRCHIT